MAKILTFTSDPLSLDLEITGPIEMVLYASSDQLDTDLSGCRIRNRRARFNEWSSDASSARSHGGDGGDTGMAEGIPSCVR